MNHCEMLKVANEVFVPDMKAWKRPAHTRPAFQPSYFGGQPIDMHPTLGKALFQQGSTVPRMIMSPVSSLFSSGSADPSHRSGLGGLLTDAMNYGSTVLSGNPSREGWNLLKADLNPFSELGAWGQARRRSMENAWGDATAMQRWWEDPTGILNQLGDLGASGIRDRLQNATSASRGM